jgi:type IV secretory pathway VirB4 component
MSIRIEKLKKPDLGVVKMNCDGVIHKKLTEYPMIEEAFSTSHFTIICGRPGQGKTSLLTSLIKNVLNKCYETIYVFMPENSRASIENDLFGKNLPEEQLFDNLDLESISKVYEEINDHTKEKYNSLIIIDDLQVALKDPDILKVLQRIITKMRHLRTSIFILNQNFQALHKPLRELASNIIFFNLGKSQLEKIFDELIQLDKTKYQNLIDIAFQNAHDYLLINLHKSRTIYRNGDRVIFN